MADSQKGGSLADKGCPYCGSDRFEVQIRLGKGGEMDSSGVQVTCKQCGRQLTLDELKLKQEPAKVEEKKPAEVAAPAATKSATESRGEGWRTPSSAAMDISVGNDAVLEARPAWRSGKIGLAPNGTFITNLWAEKGRANTFLIEVCDAQGTRCETVPDRLNYTVGMAITDPPMIHSVGVALATGEMLKFCEKGVPLPSRRREVLRTAVDVRRG
ncbi:MAG: hypothetical protein M1453_12625 [Acidobacteria bacterium]|nr:hypothetical protein [Acidobacteriota bacterium]MCL5288824.1 hypothetical protein [Acidobacteriota bacterium]